MGTRVIPPGQTDRIREMRHELGLSQEQLAVKMGINRLYVLRLENGMNKATSHAMRKALAKGFDLDIDVLERLLRGDLTVKTAMRMRRVPRARTGTEG
jgi:transcriptional regulator with XRE-family HTH domain